MQQFHADLLPYLQFAVPSVPIKTGLRKAKLSQDLILLVEDTSREVVNEMMKMHGWIDVLVPRGGAALIANVVANSTVPVIETGTGNCHVYVDETADIKIEQILLKMRRHSALVCVMHVNHL